MKSARNKITSFWTTVIGDEKSSLEAKIFHSVTMLAILMAIINMAINFWIGLLIYGLLIIPLVAVLIFGYYLSKYKNKLNTAVSIFAFTFNLLCGITYFASGGSESVNLFTFILIVFLLSFLSSKKQFKIWVPITILHVVVLFTLEYFFPELPKPLYATEHAKLIDVAQTWIEVACMIALIMMYIQNNYHKEKELAHSRLITLEEINETKNKLFSIVAHDLRAPLASIENYLSVLSKIDLSAEEKKGIEQSLLSSTKQTSEMLQNILSWSKDQMFGITVSIAEINLHESLSHTISLHRMIAEEKNIQLNAVIPIHIKVLADSDMLQLIVRNLLNNAIKFSQPETEISLNCSTDDHHCTIEISDQGIGIDNTSADDDIFSVKHKTSYGTNNEKGVGLGLMLAKNYIELQQGKIWYQSNINGGTSFFISLVLVNETSVAPA
ncbi:MAG: HAMP domain-containing histidine kinase [Pedobacter sp.]|nr:MAG: HAMP domain-containing histidine kinase [Pedobacter sp.]